MSDGYQIKPYTIHTLTGAQIQSWAVINANGDVITTAATRELARRWLDGWKKRVERIKKASP